MPGFRFTVVLALLVISNIGITCFREREGRILEVDFIYLEDSAVHKNIEDDVRRSLSKLGIKVVGKPLSKESWNAATQAGEFNLAFSETWGPPYDPHAFVASFRVPNEAEYFALQQLELPMTKPMLDGNISQVLRTANESERASLWKNILTTLHTQGVFLPLSYLQNLAVVSNRLDNFTFGQQQFDMALSGLRPLSGSTTLALAPASQTGLFNDIGDLNPHSYRPNEFFSNDLVYEGLVSYGVKGEILPALAASWEVQEVTRADGNTTQKITFNLRRNVTFHDGEEWNAAAAKANFDHVLHDALVSGDYHGWYDLIFRIEKWEAEDEFTFSITLDSYYYPALQELTFIRPIRFISPAMLPSLSTNENSCSKAWGNLSSPDNSTAILCVGVKGVAGTGPWKFKEKVTNQRTITGNDVATKAIDSDNGEVLLHVLFTRNDEYWGPKPSLEAVKVMRYEDHKDVKTALLNGDLDMVYGSGVLKPEDFVELQSMKKEFSTHVSSPLNTRTIVINSAKWPTTSASVRKAIVHGVDKQSIIQSELLGLEAPAETLFPRSLPYCDIDLEPPLMYDAEKAALLLDFAGWTSRSNEIQDLESYIDATQQEAQGSGTSHQLANEVPKEEKEALLAFKASITEDPFGVLRVWDESSSPCQPPGWIGLTCNCSQEICHVTHIDLGSAQLEGTITPQIEHLKQLKVLWLNANRLSGDLPSSAFGSLVALESLSTRGNFLTGGIPPELGSLPQLQTILMQMNKHTGSIPKELGNLKNLATLNLGFNQLTGSIPSELAAAASLSTLYLGYNNLSGPFPVGIARLAEKSLKVVDVRENNIEAVTDADEAKELSKVNVLGLEGVTGAAEDVSSMSGEVPKAEKDALLSMKRGFTSDPYNFLHSWREDSSPCGSPHWLGIGCTCSGGDCHVTQIDLGSANIAGTLSPAVGDLVSLSTFWINGNQLSGSLPEEVGRLTNVTGCSTRGNFFSGPLPSSLSALGSLEYFLAQYNYHSGAMPQALASMKTIQTINLSFNNLTGPIPRWIGNLTGLETLSLAFNELNGKIPVEVARLADFGLTTLDLRGNDIETRASEYSEEELQMLSKIPHALVSSGTQYNDNSSSQDSVSEETQGSGGLPGWVIPVVSVVGALAVVGVVAAVFAVILVKREKEGNPMFTQALLHPGDEASHQQQVMEAQLATMSGTTK